jgi:hypothetical protein
MMHGCDAFEGHKTRMANRVSKIIYNDAARHEEERKMSTSNTDLATAAIGVRGLVYRPRFFPT